METEVKAKGRKRDPFERMNGALQKMASLDEQEKQIRQEAAERIRKMREEALAEVAKAREMKMLAIGELVLSMLGERVTVDDIRKRLDSKGSAKTAAPIQSAQVEAQGGGSPSAPGGSL